MGKKFSRRKFINSVSVGSVAVLSSNSFSVFAMGNQKQLAIFGGQSIRQKEWPKWPAMLADDKMIESVTKTTRSGAWSRINNPVNGTVASFEREYAKLTGAKYCVGTGSGTQALSTCVEALGIGPGDEVITSPYTDFGTISSIICNRALAVQADLDPASFQLDAKDVERKINKNTKAIMPVHMMGMPCEMDAIMALAAKHNLYVIEDACQANFAHYKGRQLGTIGNLGCFSFQASKQISCGEGGAVIGDDEVLMDKVYTVQNHGTNRKGVNVTIGQKFRMNEFEGAILIAQLDSAMDRFKKRNENGNFLDSELKNFKGLVPQKRYEGTESCGYYHYAMSYHKEHFNNASRAQFLKAIAAEGIPLSPYIKGLHTEPWTGYILQLPEYKKMYSTQRLKQFKEELKLPMCDQVGQEMVVLSGSGPLLGSKQDMADVINAIMKVYANRDKLSSIQV
jgi:dTDP-4-amino-4,6-dideoxygalactose transaminase